MQFDTIKPDPEIGAVMCGFDVCSFLFFYSVRITRLNPALVDENQLQEIGQGLFQLTPQ